MALANAVRWPRNEDVQRTIAASRPWSPDADLPDVLNMRDVETRPDLAADALRRRREERRVHGQPRRFAYPKPTGAMRQLVALDVLSQIDFRLRVGSVVGPIEHGLSAGVMRSRTVGTGPGWKTADWKAAFREFGDALEFHRSVPGTELVTDIKNHYGSVDPLHLGRVLLTVGADSPQVDPVIKWLVDLNELPGMPQGLPISIEASAPLGTVALVPLDRCLEREGFIVLRWMDDIHVFAPSKSGAEEALGLLHGQAAVGRQSLNDGKTHLRVRGDRDEDYSIGGSWGSVRTPPLFALAATGNPDGVTRALGGLRAAESTTGVEDLIDYPWLIDRFPKQTASYLRAVSQKVTDAQVERLVPYLLADTTPVNAGGQLHLARWLRSRSSLPTDVGERVFERARRLDVHAFAPTAGHLLALAGRSQEKVGKRRKRALELASETVDLDIRRSLLASCAGQGPLDKQSRLGLQHLGRQDRDLLAATEWALSMN